MDYSTGEGENTTVILPPGYPTKIPVKLYFLSKQNESNVPVKASVRLCWFYDLDKSPAENAKVVLKKLKIPFTPEQEKKYMVYRVRQDEVSRFRYVTEITDEKDAVKLLCLQPNPILFVVYKAFVRKDPSFILPLKICVNEERRILGRIDYQALDEDQAQDEKPSGSEKAKAMSDAKAQAIKSERMSKKAGPKKRLSKGESKVATGAANMEESKSEVEATSKESTSQLPLSQQGSKMTEGEKEFGYAAERSSSEPSLPSKGSAVSYTETRNRTNRKIGVKVKSEQTEVLIGVNFTKHLQLTAFERNKQMLFRCETAITLVRDSSAVFFKDIDALNKELVNPMNIAHCPDGSSKIYETKVTNSYVQVRCTVKGCKFMLWYSFSNMSRHSPGKVNNIRFSRQINYNHDCIKHAEAGLDL